MRCKKCKTVIPKGNTKCYICGNLVDLSTIREDKNIERKIIVTISIIIIMITIFFLFIMLSLGNHKSKYYNNKTTNENELSNYYYNISYQVPNDLKISKVSFDDNKIYSKNAYKVETSIDNNSYENLLNNYKNEIEDKSNDNNKNNIIINETDYKNYKKIEIGYTYNNNLYETNIKNNIYIYKIDDKYLYIVNAQTHNDYLLDKDIDGFLNIKITKK